VLSVPFVLGAIAVHALLAEWAASSAQPSVLEPQEVPDFEFRLVRSTSLRGGSADERFDPRESLSSCGERISCGYSIEVVDGIEVHIGHCWFSRTDELDYREKLLAEIADQGGGVPWAGDYFRGSENQGASAVTLGPCGGAWARTCSLADGIGEGRSGDVLEYPGGLLRFRLGRHGESLSWIWPVRWGERRYLVEPERLEEFLRQARSGVEPRASIYGGFLMRDGDEQLPVDGDPRIGNPDS
jgi:hypothetical protein